MFSIWSKLYTDLPKVLRLFFNRSEVVIVLSVQEKTEEFFFHRLWSSTAGSNSPPELSRIWASPARHLWHYFLHLWPLVLTNGRGPTVGSPRNSFVSPSTERVGWHYHHQVVFKYSQHKDGHRVISEKITALCRIRISAEAGYFDYLFWRGQMWVLSTFNVQTGSGNILYFASG